MKATWFVTAVLFCCGLARAQYTYYYSDTFSSINSANWTQNGSPAIQSNGSGFTSSSSASLISTITGPGPYASNSYEVRARLNLPQSGGAYIVMLRATSNAVPGSGFQGNFYDFELVNPTYSNGGCTATVDAYKVINGSATLSYFATVSCHDQMVIRAVIAQPEQSAYLYIDGQYIGGIYAADIASGQPGVAVIGAPSTNGIAEADLGPLDTTPPSAVSVSHLRTSAFPNRVDIQWQAALDDPTGSGVAYYTVLRDSGFLGSYSFSETLFTDQGVQPSSQYTYSIETCDFHGNCSLMSFNVTTPPPGAIDPREVGMRPTGSYWGYGSEQVDMRTGNLNFSIPLIQSMARTGWGFHFNLSYNSQKLAARWRRCLESGRRCRIRLRLAITGWVSRPGLSS